MTEVPKVGELGHEIREPRGTRMGLDAIERAMRSQPEPPAAAPEQAWGQIEIALSVNGRLVNTRTDSETVFRVLAILTGLDR